MSTTVTGGKRPFSASGGIAESSALRGKGVVIPGTPGEDGSGTGERECGNCADRIMAKALINDNAGNTMRLL